MKISVVKLRQIGNAILKKLKLIGVIVVVLSVPFLLWKLPKWQVAYSTGLTSANQFDRENEARKTLAQIFGGLFLIAGLYFTWKNLVETQENVKIASEGQITDRFTKAIEQLGDTTKIEVRLGGIYALERIARDSHRDHWPIMEVLTACVRDVEHQPVGKKQTTILLPHPSMEAFALEQRVAPDVQAILTVIGRRTLTYEREDHRLDLHNTNLRVANLTGADLSRAVLVKANLTWADLSKANLTGADLRRANLTGADLTEAILTRAHLAEANLTKAELGRANLTGADLTWAFLTGAVLIEANLTGALLIRTDFDGAFLSKANLTGALFPWAILTGADLTEAILTEAYLADANLTGAVLTGANLDGAKLVGAVLSEAQGLRQEQIELAKGDEETKLPEGLQRPKHWVRQTK